MVRIRHCNIFCSLLNKKASQQCEAFLFKTVCIREFVGVSKKAKPLADKIYNLAALSLDTVYVLSNSYAFKNIAFAFVLSPSLT